MSFICCMYQLFSFLEAKINISDSSNRASAFGIFFFFLRGKKIHLCQVCRRVLWFYFAHYCPLCLALLKFPKPPVMKPNDCVFPPGFPFFFFLLISASSFAADTHCWEPSRISARPLCFVPVPTSESGTGYEHWSAYIYTKQMIHCWAEILTYSIHSNKELRQIKRLIWVAFWCGQVRS